MSSSLSKEEQKQIAFIIIKAAQYLHHGKGLLALFLRGSHSQLIKDKELDRKLGYGALLWHDLPTIKGFISQLEEMGFLNSYLLQTELHSYPVLTVTEAGRKVLEEKLNIPLLIRKEIKPISIGDSEQETFSLFKQGCKPQEIAKRRGLVVSTIFGHFNKLIAVGEIKVRQCVSDEAIRKVLSARKTSSSLHEMKQMLPDISYEEIRLVLADKTLM